MGYTIAQKIIKNHLLSGEMTVGSEIGLRIDQTLTQDATGTMAYLEFEAMGGGAYYINMPKMEIGRASCRERV